MTPWSIASSSCWAAQHDRSLVIWGAGSDFVSADMRQVTFVKPEAKAGAYAYFYLAHCLSPAARPDIHTLVDRRLEETAARLNSTLSCD